MFTFGHVGPLVDAYRFRFNGRPLDASLNLDRYFALGHSIGIFYSLGFNSARALLSRHAMCLPPDHHDALQRYTGPLAMEEPALQPASQSTCLNNTAWMHACCTACRLACNSMAQDKPTALFRMQDTVDNTHGSACSNAARLVASVCRTDVQCIAQGASSVVQ